jgi:hypothetical protein
MNKREVILKNNPLQTSDKLICSYHINTFNEFLFDNRNSKNKQIGSFACNKEYAKKLALFIIENL